MEVRLIDSMGDDLRVVNAARVSFHKESKELDERDIKLIKYLATHNHWTPFAHIQVTLHLKMPIFVARQFAKHTVGLVTNEVSRRYVDDAPEFFAPKEWRKRAENIKQGSSDEVIKIKDGDYKNHPCYYYDQFLFAAEAVYNRMIQDGVAPEQARMVLPQSMYTEMYTTGSLVAWARVYKLRSDPHAQKEIQDLAQMIDIAILSQSQMKNSWLALRS